MRFILLSLLGRLHNFYIKIINSVVVVGLYYGFFTAFSVGSSYFLLIRAIATDKSREGKLKRVAATTGFIVGQLITLLSIYYKPIHLLLGKPHIMTVLTLPYLLVHVFLNNHMHDYYDDDDAQSFNSQLVYVNNLTFPLFYHIMLPSSGLARSANIYMFRCNNKILFVISSFVGWFIGLNLLIKSVDMFFVWIIRQRDPIRKIIRSNKYLDRLFSDLHVLLIRLRSNKDLNRIIIRVRSSKELYILLLRFRANKFIKSINGLLSQLRPSPYLVKDFKYVVSEFQHLVFELRRNMSRSFCIIFFSIFLIALGRAPSAIFTRKMIQPFRKGELEEEITIIGNPCPIVWFENEKVPVFLFNHRRWTSPSRHIKNNEFETPYKVEVSQETFFFSSAGMFITCPTRLGNIFKILHEKMMNILLYSGKYFAGEKLEKFLCDELHNFDYWIHTNEKKLCSLRNEFTDRIKALDTGSPYRNVLEKKIQLCNDKTKKEYLPKIYDPFLNGSYRGIMNESFLLSILNQTESILNQTESILNQTEWRNIAFEKKNRVFSFFSKYKKRNVLTGKKTPAETTRIEKQKISKELPRWPYRLSTETAFQKGIGRLVEEDQKRILPNSHMRGKKLRRIVIFKDPLIAAMQKALLDTPEKVQKAKDNKEDEKGENFLITYPYMPNFRRNIITGSMRFQRRKAVVARILQVTAHSPLFFNVIGFYMQHLFDAVISRVIDISDRIQDIFVKIFGKIFTKITRRKFKWKKKISYQRALQIETAKTLGAELARLNTHHDKILDEHLIDEEEEQRAKSIDAFDNMDLFLIFDPAIARTQTLFVQSKIRKRILLPSLILAKNIVRLLLLQKPELNEDIRDLQREVHIPCTDNDTPIPKDELDSELWKKEDVDTQIHIVIKHPFRLKPWHRSKRKRDPMKKKIKIKKTRKNKNNRSYLTCWGMETDRHFGSSKELLQKNFSSFFEPIKKKSKKASRKWSFLVRKFLKIKKRRKSLNVAIKRIKKKTENFIKRFRSKKKMIHESSIQNRSMDRTDYSPTESKMKELTDTISTTRNQIKTITKDKKRTRKKNTRRNARLIRKSYFFIKWIGERIYTDFLLGTLPQTIQKIFLSIIESLYRCMSIIKRFLTFQTKYKTLIELISTRQKKLSLSHLTPKIVISSLRNRRKKLTGRTTKGIFVDLSHVSQTYVFYKLLQNWSININLSKLRSGLQDDGASLFLKNEIKDSFRRQGIISDELKHKKLQGSRMNRWRNMFKRNRWNRLLKKNQWIKWLKSHYQYELSDLKWYTLGPQEWRSEVYRYRVENRNVRKRKRNSSKREKKVSLLRHQNYHLQKTYRYDKRAYQSISYEDKKDSYSYGSAFQIHKPNLIDMGGSSPIENYIRKDHFFENITFFDMKGLDLLYLKIDKEIDPSNQKQKRNLFDWMGMNEEIDRMGMNEEIDRMGMNEEERNPPYSRPCPQSEFGVKKTETDGFQLPLIIGQEDWMKSEIQIPKTQVIPLAQWGFVHMVHRNLSSQSSWGTNISNKGSAQIADLYEEEETERRKNDKKKKKKIEIKKRGDLLYLLKKMAVHPRKNMTVDPQFMEIDPYFSQDFFKLIRHEILRIEPERAFINENIKWILYQTIRISLIHEIQQKKKRDRENMDKNLLLIGIQKMINRKKNHLLVPENLLSSRRRKELRILSCLNARKSNGVYKNAVFCNGNRVKTCVPFLEKSQDLDRYKKNFMKFKFFLWPNYRFEDLACMNRYWFDTHNGSRFSMLRIHMYPRFHNGSLISMLRRHIDPRFHNGSLISMLRRHIDPRLKKNS